MGPSFAGTPELPVMELPEREYAILRHVGPYEKSGASYARLCGEWLPLSGREPAWAPALEFYRNDPRTTPPAELATDICVPLD